MSLNPKSIYIIAKKEFSDNARSRWIISLILIFLVLTIVSSIMAAVGRSAIWRTQSAHSLA